MSQTEPAQPNSRVFTRRQLSSMTLPFILDSLSIMLISMLITALISSAGETSEAAVNLVSPIFTLIVCLMNGIAAGGTVEVAQSYGSRDMERTNLAAGHILWMTFLSGTALALILILLPRPILTALYPQAEPEVLNKAVTYMVEGSFSLIIFTIYAGIFPILRGLGASQKCLCLTIVINVAYLLFSILFFNVWKMDILGSALAQILARLLGSACALAFLLHPGKLPIRLTPKILLTYRRETTVSILRVSVPFGLEQIFLYGGNIVIATMTVPLGTAAITANAIANSLQGVITAAGQAAGTLAVTVVGQCIGRGAYRDAQRYGFESIVLALGLLGISALICYPLLPTMLTGLYTTTPTMRETVLGLLHHLLIPMLLFWPISNVAPYVLRAAHDTVFPSVLSLASMWGVRIGFGYWLCFRKNLGIEGLWIAMWAEWAVRTLALSARLLSGNWWNGSKAKTQSSSSHLNKEIFQKEN